MLTSRGWWFLLSVVVLVVLGVLMQPPSASLALVGLTLGLWLAWEWLLFAVRARIITPRLRLERQLRDERGPVTTLWSGRPVEVHAALHLQGWLGLPYVAIADRLPFGTELHAGQAEAEGCLQAGKALELKYSVRCAAPGRIRFEGVTLQLADLHGLFYRRAFVPAVGHYRVLPALAEAEGPSGTVKRHNLLPPPGVHRLRRGGSGSELLELRDYLPGDPPRTVAWKVSARRDRLITKEFESEVPVRCTLFVDTSNSVRLGPPGQNGLTGLIEIAATVAQAAAGARDLIGLCLFDEQTAHVIRPARSRRHVVSLLNTLADAAGLAPTTGQADVNTLLPLAHAFAAEVYPGLIGGDLNRMPFWLPWLWPQPAYTIPQPTLEDRFIRLLPLLLLVYGLMNLALAALLLVVLAWWLHSLDVHPTAGLIIMTALGFSLMLILTVLTPRLFFPAQRRQYRWRKHLAALLSVRYGLAPGGLGLLLEDDEQLSRYLQRFLADHHVPYPLPLYDSRGHYLFAAPRKVEVLANALLRAVGKGHDNEMFVLLADLLELTDALGPLLRAIKVALARHHRVMVVCPWPPGIPAPGDGPHQDEALADRGPESPLETVQQITVRRFHRAFYQARRTFARLSVPMICAHSADPARLILSRLERLRMLGEKTMSVSETDQLSGHDAAITAYMAACGVALGAILLVLLQRLPGGRVIWALFPVLIGLLGLVTRWTSAPLMLLLILAACLHLQSHRALVSDLILCSAVLAYVTGHFRLQSLLVEVFPADPRSQEGRRRRGWLHLGGRPALVHQRRDPRLVSRQEIVGFLFTLPLWAAAAAVCLTLLSGNWGNPGLQRPVWRLVLLAWVVGGGAFLAAGFIDFWQRSKMTVEEATLLLQDTYWQETRGEQRRINRWLAWARLRRRRKENA